MIFCFDDFELDADRLELVRAGVAVRADRMVLRVLCVLLGSPGHLVTKAELMTRVWDRRAMSDSVLSVTVGRLRKTLGHARGTREFVVSVPGLGYRFVCPVTKRATHAVPRGEPMSAKTSPALVGRELAEARMKRALGSALAGRGGVCLLTGEAGIGKTASAEQLAASAKAGGARVAWAYCSEVGETPPLWPFAQLVRALLHDATADDLRELPPALATIVPELWPAAGETVPPHPKYLLFEAVLAVFERADTVLILDDFHRADTASHELLRYWIDRLGQRRVLVVATLRAPSGRRARFDSDLGFVVGHVNCTRIALEPLAPAAVHAHVRSMVPDATPALEHAVWAKSEGIPFFMVELVRQLTDTVAADRSELMDVGEHALQRLRPRLTELCAASRALLSVAAVVGRRFALRDLQRLTGQDLETITERLDRALESGTLVPIHDSGMTYAFGHELIRALFYEEFPLGERRRWHLALAEMLEQRVASGEVVTSAALAYHYHAALPCSDPLLTLGHCQRAASEARQMFAHADAVRHLRNALEALSLFAQQNPMLRLMLLFQCAVAARLAGGYGFVQVVVEAAVLARQLRSGVMLVELGLLLHVHPGLPTLPSGRTLLEEGLALLGEHEYAVRGAALARLATCGPIAFDGERSDAQSRLAMSLTGRDALLPSYHAYSAALYLAPRGPSAADVAAVLAQLGAAHPQMLRSAPALHDLHTAIMTRQAGHVREAGVALARLRSRCREMGMWELDWHAARYQVLARLDYVPVEDIVAELRALHARARTESVFGSEVMCAFDSLVVLGDPWDPRLRDALAYSPSDPPSIWAMKAHALSAAGRTEEAGTALAAVPVDALAALPHDRDHLGTLGAVARVALATGSRERMRALYRLLQPHADSLAVHGSYLCLGPVAQLLGELASALGKRTEALAHFRRARTISERLGLTSHAGEARRAASRLLSSSTTQRDASGASEADGRDAGSAG